MAAPLPLSALPPPPRRQYTPHPHIPRSKWSATAIWSATPRPRRTAKKVRPSACRRRRRRRPWPCVFHNLVSTPPSPGLDRSARLAPEEEEKVECRDWLNQSIEELNVAVRSDAWGFLAFYSCPSRHVDLARLLTRLALAHSARIQIDMVEADIEKLNGKKKKTTLVRPLIPPRGPGDAAGISVSPRGPCSHPPPFLPPCTRLARLKQNWRRIRPSWTSTSSTWRRLRCVCGMCPVGPLVRLRPSHRPYRARSSPAFSPSSPLHPSPLSRCSSASSTMTRWKSTRSTS